MPTPISISDQGFKLPVSLTNPTSATVFTDAGGSAITCQLSASPMPNPVNSDDGWQRVYQNIVFDTKAAGQVTGGTTTNVTFVLQFGNSATSGSNTTVASTGAIAINSSSGNWLIESELMWDPVSTKIQGIFWGWVGPTVVAQAAATPTTLTAANFFATGMHFTVNALFSATNAGNLATLSQFDIDPV